MQTDFGQSPFQKYLALFEQRYSDSPSFAISGHFTGDGGVHVSAVETGPFSLASFPSSEYTLMLLDASDAEIACNTLPRDVVRVYPLPSENWEPGHSVGCETILTDNFSASLPRIDGGITLAIERDGVRLWTRHAPAQFPQITNFTCGVFANHGRLQWTDNIAADSPEYCVEVFFKDADGMCGRLMRLAGTSAENDDRQQTPRNVFEFTLTELPAGAVDLTIALDSGFYTTNSEPVSVSVPAQPIIIELTEPTAGFDRDLSPKLSVYAAARAFCGPWGSINDQTAFEWAIDGEPIGSGRFLMFDYPAVGHHVATVIVHWKTQRVSASVAFEVTSEWLAEADRDYIDRKEFFPDRQVPE